MSTLEEGINIIDLDEASTDISTDSVIEFSFSFTKLSNMLNVMMKKQSLHSKQIKYLTSKLHVLDR